MSNQFFKWSSDFNTGNSIVDLQHYNLVKIINGLLEYSIDNTSKNIEDIYEIVGNLKNYTIEHFATEEKLISDYKIDPRHSKDHISSHNDFVYLVSKYFDDDNNIQDSDKISEIVEYLIRWLAYHILNTDKSLITQVNYISKESLTPRDAYDKDEKFTESSTEPLLKALKVLYLLVSKKNKEIEQKNIELEKKVETRTKELYEANKKLSGMLYKDELTGLPNRRFVMDEIKRLINNWERYGVPFSILFIDIDKFKLVNDNYGHETGDKVLKNTAEFLRDNIRKTDIACRLSGDEFIVLCPHTDYEGSLTLGKKLNNLCTQKCDKRLEHWNPSFSIGISTINKNCTSASEILQKADNAMYVSKAKGGGQTSV